MKRSSKQNKFNISGLLWNPHPFSIESFGTLPLYMYFYKYFICIAGSLESAYSLIWGSHKIWGKGGGDTLDLL